MLNNGFKPLCMIARTMPRCGPMRLPRVHRNRLSVHKLQAADVGRLCVSVRVIPLCAEGAQTPALRQVIMRATY